MTTTAEWVGKIASEHAGQPKFAATVAFSVDPLVRMEAALRKLAVVDFDLDQAVGPQLDAVGERVGRSRVVPYALQGLFFTWGDPNRGWGRGIWKGPYDVGSSLSSLDDDTYRRLLRSKILANSWDGTLDGLQGIYTAYFDDPATRVFLSDDAYNAQQKNYFSWGDARRGWGAGEWAPIGAVQGEPSIPATPMQVTVAFAGKIPAPIDLALLDAGLVGAKPEGVTVHTTVTSVDGAPLFGFGQDSPFIAGWGSGAWGNTPAELLAAS